MSQKCPDCGRAAVKRGLRHNKNSTKQLYLCKKCEKTFVEPDGFERMRFSPEIISRAVHQHEDGFSLSKVQNHLYQHDGVKVSRWAIAKWKKKFSIFFGSNSSRVHARDKRAHTYR